MMSFVVPSALLMAGLAAALGAYVLYRNHRAEHRMRDLGEGALYAAGKEAAVRRAPSQSVLASVLREAGIDTTPVLWLARAIAACFFMACVMVALSKSLALGVVAGGVVALSLCVRVGMLRCRRGVLLDRQFARILPQVAASVRSSLTLERALRSVAAHVDDPLREELARVLADVAYGTPLSQAIEQMAHRTASPDVRAFAAAVRVQQRFGGAIAPVLDMLAAHANARLKAQRELKTELAGTRLAKWFVAAAMPAIFMLMFITNVDFARFYREEPLGWAVMGFAAVCEVFGLVACQRITTMREETCG